MPAPGRAARSGQSASLALLRPSTSSLRQYSTPGALSLASHVQYDPPTNFELRRRPYATSAYSQAQPNSAVIGNKGDATAQEASKKETPPAEEQNDSNSGEQPDPDEPPKKATIRERLRFLTRRYGWWALGVYLLASAVDFSLVFAAIHLLGADHIRGLEERLRRRLGMGDRKMEDHEVAAWPVPVVTPVEGTAKQVISGGVANNQDAARAALRRREGDTDAYPTSASPSSSTGAEKPAQDKRKGNSALWTEAVLAYTIHKTLLLPFRVGVTAAITPSFVKYLVRMGWARDNAAVHQATARAKAMKASRKADV